MPYNWPVKIAKYGITCPFQKFLVAKYESVIDWNGARITSTEALDAHIRDKMIPDLRRRLDPEDKKSHYCRAINLAAVLNNPAEHFNEVRGIHQRDGEEAARKFLLDRINRDKKEGFDAWWNYLTQGNPVYADQPAFQYIILRPVIETSDAKCTRQPFPLDAEAVAFVHDGIEKESIDPSQNLIRKLAEFTAFGARAEGDRPAFGTECAWITITNDMPNAANRVAALSKGRGWCVASSYMAQSYLQSSDFHLLVEKGRAEVAIRMARGKVEEIQGHGNSDPGLWWPRILLYLNTRACGISNNRRHQAAASFAAQCKQELAAIKTVKKLSEVLKEQPAIVQFIGDEQLNDEMFKPVIEEAWLACTKADPMAGVLAPIWMARDHNMDAALVEGWINILKVDVFAVRTIPEFLYTRKELKDEIWLAWGGLLYQDPNAFDSCPPDLCNDPDILSARRAGWISYLKRCHDNLTDCPPDLLGDPEILALRSTAWAQFADQQAHRFELTCPADLKSLPEIDAARRRGWKRRILNHHEAWLECPADLKDGFEDDYLESVRKIIRNKPSNSSQRFNKSNIRVVLKKAINATSRRELITECMISVLLANQTGFFSDLDIPEDIRQHPDYRCIREAAWREVVSARPPFCAAVPDDLRHKPGMSLMETTGSRANLALWQWRVQKKPWLIEQASTVPKSIRHSHALFEAYIDGWASKLRDTPWRFWTNSMVRPHISYAVLYHPKIMDALRDGWIARNDRNRLVRAWNNASTRMKQLLAVQLSVLRALKMIHEKGWYWPREVFEELAGIYKDYTCNEHASDLEKNIHGQISTLVNDLKDASPRPAKYAQRKPGAVDGGGIQPHERSREDWLSCIRSDPRNWQYCPANLQADADMRAELKIGWLKLVDADPSIHGIPLQLADDSDLRRTIINAWRRNQDLLANDCLSWPAFVCEDQIMSRRAITVFTRAIRANPVFWLSLPERWRQNNDLRNEAATSWAHSPNCANKEPPEDIRELVEELQDS